MRPVVRDHRMAGIDGGLMSRVQHVLRPGLAFVILATGCYIGSWSRVPVPPPDPVPDTLRTRRDLQIWLKDSVSPRIWEHVVIGRDSVSGIPGEPGLFSHPRRISVPVTIVVLFFIPEHH
jgi:hypothetical protein